MDWKLISEIPGYEAFTNYELNIAGDLRNRETGRLRKWCENKADDYLRAKLHQKGLKKQILKHLAICHLFKPNPENKPFIDHWNRNKLDNSFDNLRWVTREENMHNKSISSRNTSGEHNIFGISNNGTPIWQISIMSHGERYTEIFPRDPNSDVIPQEVIDKRDEMKRTHHPTSINA